MFVSSEQNRRLPLPSICYLPFYHFTWYNFVIATYQCNVNDLMLKNIIGLWEKMTFPNMWIRVGVSIFNCGAHFQISCETKFSLNEVKFKVVIT